MLILSYIILLSFFIILENKSTTTTTTTVKVRYNNEYNPILTIMYVCPQSYIFCQISSSVK